MFFEYYMKYSEYYIISPKWYNINHSVNESNQLNLHSGK